MANTICDNVQYGSSLCDGTFGGESILLNTTHLSGTIPSALSLLTKLTSLQMVCPKGRLPFGVLERSSHHTPTDCQTGLSGTIPWASFGSLTTIDLSENLLSGTVPTRLPALLQHLNLYAIPVSGSIPSVQSTTLKTLSMVKLYEVDGTIPSGLDSLAALEDL